MSFINKDDPAVALCYYQWTKANEIYQKIKTQRGQIDPEDLLHLRKRLEFIQDEARRAFDKLSCWQQGEKRAKKFKFLIYETDALYVKLFESNPNESEAFFEHGDIFYATYIQFLALFHEKYQYTPHD